MLPCGSIVAGESQISVSLKYYGLTNLNVIVVMKGLMTALL